VTAESPCSSLPVDLKFAPVVVTNLLWKTHLVSATLRALSAERGQVNRPLPEHLFGSGMNGMSRLPNSSANSEVGAADRLSAEQVAHCLDVRELMIQVRLTQPSVH
jgi:hypothetical protein